MGVKLLTDEWFLEIERIVERIGGVEPNEKLRNIVININSKEPDGSIIECCYRGCIFKKGHAPDAQATLSTSRELLYKVMVLKNMAEGMKAILTKKATLQGDQKQLMPLSAAKPSPSQAAYEAELKAMTEL